MERWYSKELPRSERIPKLIEHLFEQMPQIEADRAVLLTESYMRTEGEPIISRRADAFASVLDSIPITLSLIHI